ncbi:MAG TPA: hypothetical protein VFM77_09045 [Terriglobales bacterium]|nr:hypothetical protein [Terriglobales bacterium]
MEPIYGIKRIALGAHGALLNIFLGRHARLLFHGAFDHRSPGEQGVMHRSWRTAKRCKHGLMPQRGKIPVLGGAALPALR